MNQAVEAFPRRNLADQELADEERASIQADGISREEIRRQVQERAAAQGKARDIFPLLKNAASWILEPPKDPDQILSDVFDRGDKVVLIGSSKSRKTFFLLQMLLSIAAGRAFLGWRISKPRKVLHVQFEIQEHHFHRRLLRMCPAMSINPSDLENRFQILNARGRNISGPEGIEKVGLCARILHADIISFDPLYKVLTGDENSNGADGMKGTLELFDRLAEDTGAAIIYAHHDPKGTPGDRSITDRGAGAGVLARDYDASIVMTTHATEDDAFVIETSLRNYRPQEPFTVLWTENEDTEGYCFEERLDILATKKTSKASKTAPELDTYLPMAFEILADKEMQAREFKKLFKEKTGIGDKKIRGFLAFATAGGSPHIVERSDPQSKNLKWIRKGWKIE